MNGHCEYVYIATDGRYSKVGVSSNPERRTPRPIRTSRKDGRGAPVRIVKYWHRPTDARWLEVKIRQSFSGRCIAGAEWFDMSVRNLSLAVDREIWYKDELPKDRMARCPILLRDVLNFPLDVSRPMVSKTFKERGGKAGRKPSLDDKGKATALKLLNAGELSKAGVARECGISPTTINNYFEWQPRKKVWREKQK